MTSESYETPSGWPYWSLLLCGHFGRATPAARRLNREAASGLMLLAVTTAAALLLQFSPYGRLIFVAGAAGATGWILLAFRRYFAQLDELSLRMQYEAIAFAFGLMLLLGVTISAADLMVHPLTIVIAEPLRGLGLVLAARRYQ